MKDPKYLRVTCGFISFYLCCIFVYCMSCEHVDKTGQDDCNLASPSPSLTGPPPLSLFAAAIEGGVHYSHPINVESSNEDVFFEKTHVDLQRTIVSYMAYMVIANSVGCEFMVSSCSPPQLVDSN